MIFGADPSMDPYVSPYQQSAFQGQALLNLGLGLMAGGSDRLGFGHGVASAFQGAQQNYNDAMDRAFRNTLMKQQADYQQKERDLQLQQQDVQLKQAQRTEREQASQTAQRLSTGITSASDPAAYWNLVQNSPEVTSALSTLGIQAPYIGPLSQPGNFDAFKQQLATAGTIGAPAQQPIKLSAGDVLLQPGTYQQVASAAPKSTVEWKDAGDKLIPVDAVSGQRRTDLAPIPKSMPPGQQFDPGSVEQTANMIANGQMPMLSGFSLKTPWGQAVVQRVAQIKPDYNAQDYTVGQQTRTAFAKGPQGNTVRSLNVAVQHLNTLSDLTDALGNGNLPALNKIANTWKTQTGQAAPTNFEAAKKIVADEVVKAIVGSGGAVADREQAAATINAASSPQQLKQVISTYQQLMGGQLSGLKQQYEANTGQKDFEKFLSPETQQKLESHTQQKSKGNVTSATLTAYAAKYGISEEQARQVLSSQGYQVP